MKKAIVLSAMFTLVLFLGITHPATAQAVDVSGKWDMKVELSVGSGTPTFVLKQAGETITGTYKGQMGEAPVTGTLKGTSITLEFKAGEYSVVYTGSVEGNTMKGKVGIGTVAEGTFTGKKE